jgi:hypothetical protein
MSDKHNRKDTPMEAMWMSLTGASASLHEEVPGIDANSQKVGHEPDEFGLRGIVYVPIAVTLALVVTYLIVSGTFRYVIGRGDTVAEVKPFNDRAGRISSDIPKPLDNQPAVAQPRLEGIHEVNMARSGMNGQVDPPYLRSFLPTEKGNSPEIYPESLRPENFVDPTTHQRSLAEYGWVEEGKVARIPIDTAIQLMVKNNKLPTNAKPVEPGIGTLGKAKLSSGGRGGPAEPKVPEEHKHDHNH